MVAVTISKRSETIEGVLREIEGVLGDLKAASSFSQLKTKLGELSERLLAFCQEDLSTARKIAAERKKPWEDKISVGVCLREQDGLMWSHEDTVEIGDKIRMVYQGGEWCGKVICRERLEWIMSKDETFLEEVRHKISKIFRNGAEEKIILWEAIVELRNNMIWRVAIIRNIDTPPSDRGSFYHRPTPAIIHHELVLN